MHSLSPEKLCWIQVQKLAGPIKVFGRVFLKPLLCVLGHILWVVVLLKCKLLCLPENFSTADTVTQDCPMFFYIFPLIQTSLKVPVAEKNIPTALCLTVGIVLMRWCSLLGFLHTNQRILLLMVCKLFRCLLANSQWAVICILVTNGFCLATLPWRSDRGSAAPVVVLL